MSHMIEGNRMFYAGEVPWHGLGRRVGKAVTSAEAIKLAQLNTTVEMMLVFVKVGKEFIPAEEYRAAVRTEDSSIFGIASREYSPYQNHECFEFMDSLVADGSLKYETAGSLFGGKKVWILARLPEVLRIGKGDIIHKYLFLLNGHDRKTALTVLPTSVRVVCNNTANMALGRARRQFTVHIKHRGSLEARISEARQILQLSHVEFKLFDQVAKALDKRDGLPLVDKFLNTLFPVPEKDDSQQAKSLYEAQMVDVKANLVAEGQARGGDLSAWSLLQGVTGYFQHHDSDRGKKDEYRQDRRMRSMMFGKRAKRVEEATNILLSMTKIMGDVQKARERLMVPVLKG